MAIVLGEPEADRCINALVAESELVISAVTVAEALIVAASGCRLLYVGDDFAKTDL